MLQLAMNPHASCILRDALCSSSTDNVSNVSCVSVTMYVYCVHAVPVRARGGAGCMGGRASLRPFPVLRFREFRHDCDDSWITKTHQRLA